MGAQGERHPGHARDAGRFLPQGRPEGPAREVVAQEERPSSRTVHRPTWPAGARPLSSYCRRLVRSPRPPCASHVRPFCVWPLALPATTHANITRRGSRERGSRPRRRHRSPRTRRAPARAEHSRVDVAGADGDYGRARKRSVPKRVRALACARVQCGRERVAGAALVESERVGWRSGVVRGPTTSRTSARAGSRAPRARRPSVTLA